MIKPDKGEWAELYAALRQFGQTGPWRWMDDTDIVAVEDPEGGEVGYCVVMGSSLIQNGLAVYLGDDGFESYVRLMGGDLDPESWEEVRDMRSLSAMFADRAHLQGDDLSTIRSLGLRYRGKGAWPLFRSSRPGYFPWFLEAQEARFLGTALRQLVIVAERLFDRDLELYNPSDPDLVFTRRFRNGSWHDGWTRPNIPTTTPEVPDFADLVRLKRLGESTPDRFDAWELSRFRISPPLQDKRGERPYYPTVIMAVERGIGLIVGNKLMGAHPTVDEQQAVIVSILETSPRVPGAILVESEALERLLESITRPLGIKLAVEPTPTLQEAKEALETHFSSS